MKTKENVNGGEANVKSAPGKSSLPAGDENSNRVKDGIGVPDAQADRNNDFDKTGKNSSKKWHFSNERPIF